MTKNQLKKLLTITDHYKEVVYIEAEENNHSAWLPGELEQLDELQTILIEEINK